MSSQLSRMVTGFGAIVVAFGLAVATAGAAYESTDNRVPSPQYMSTNTVNFNTPGGLYRIDSFFDVFTDISRVPPPPPGSTTFHSFFDVFTELSMMTPGGPMTWAANADGAMRLSSQAGLPPGQQVIETEMLAMNLVGGSFPPGVGIRESPTLPSLGRTEMQDLGGGRYHIDSFFDVFTELTLDGGSTWTPSDAPLHITGMPEPGGLTLLGLAALAALRRRRRA